LNTQRKKRVLVVGQHYWPETFRVTDICEGLVERGYEVDVLCGTPNYPAGKIFPGYQWFKKRKQVHNGVNIIRVPEIPRGSNSNIRIFLNYISYPFFAILYLPFILFKKYDRILAYELSPVFMMLPAIILSKVKRVQLFVYILDFWPHSLFSIINFKSKTIRSLLTKMSYWHYRKADGLIGAFKGIQTRLVSQVGIRKEDTLYIPQAPEKIYEKEISDRDLEVRFKDTFNIVFAGNINPAQSFDVITKAAKIVFKRGYTNLNYIIIGEGMSKKWLMDEVKNLKIANQFTFEGFKPVEEIPKYQSIADVLIVALSKSPLFEYGIPAKVNSYMASGKPIVGAMDGEGQRLINNYSNCGICVDSGDELGLSKAIIKLIEMRPEERKAMGKNGQKYHFENFEREHNLDRFVEFVFNNNRITDKEYADE